ncbi:hypothetical protein ACWCQN_21180 [Streptomyces sp. NPDC001984]|uniref:hypothetical protein n=1 Tax=Streptomyces sp. NPDC002619 TaxID=3364655 RepID=UPI0036AE8443
MEAEAGADREREGEADAEGLREAEAEADAELEAETEAEPDTDADVDAEPEGPGRSPYAPAVSCGNRSTAATGRSRARRSGKRSHGVTAVTSRSPIVETDVHQLHIS